MRRILLLIVIGMMITTFCVYPQNADERLNAASNQIDTLLTSYIHGPYQVSVIVDIDSSVENQGIADGRISNPYGTLNRCYLFTAKTINQNGKSCIGVFKNNQIIWMSDQLPGSQDYGDYDEGFLATKDLNRTGKVDIAVFFSDGTNPPSEYSLWIFSWDGSQGACINQQEPDGRTSIVSASGFDIYDVDSDGKDEIITFGSDFKVNATYSWNGSLYGEWPNSPNLIGKIYTPANNLIAVVNTVVTHDRNKFTFSYQVKNNLESKQKIKWIHIGSTLNSIDTVVAPIGWKGGYWRDKYLVNFFTANDSVNLVAASQLGGFSVRSNGLPIISKFYLQAPSECLDLSSKSDAELSNQNYEDVLNNSFTGFTISAGNIPKPFSHLNFLDTLSSFTTQSRTLGWIKDDATENKYLSYFEKARTKLMQRDSGGARAALLPVLHDVVVDTASVLTSEAYALIRFNTEYLVHKLPQTQITGCVVKLVNSTGLLLTNGVLQYSDTTWKDATNNNDGTFAISTTKKKLSLKMTYEYGTQTKSNVTIGNDTIIFQTKNVAVNLQTSAGAPIDTGIVRYDASGWQTFGTTSSGVVTKELLPIKYTFKMTYNGASVNKAQNIDSNTTVVFQTVPAKVQLQTSNGSPLDTGMVQYNAGGWRDFGTTSNGVVTKELLPIKYTFKMTYNGASVNKAQNIDSNTTVIFQTVLAQVQLQSSTGTLLNGGIVEYNSDGWKAFGTTINGLSTKELLGVKYNFRMTYEAINITKAQNIDSNATISFSTVPCTIHVTKTSGALLDNATVSYNGGGWQIIGTTVNGIVTKELLPDKIQFRAAFGTKQQSKTQDVSANPLIEITLPVQ